MEELNALSLLVAFVLPVLVGFSCYWQGFNNGKREGYIAGRSLMRVPVKNDR